MPVSERTYVLINDTEKLSGGIHIGTCAVKSTITEEMRSRGFSLLATLNHQEDYRLFLEKNQRPSIVIFNGEGTMHHDAKRALELLAISTDMSARSCKCVLINTLWEENSLLTTRQTAHFALIATRDSHSRKSLLSFRSDIGICPDLSIPYFIKTKVTTPLKTTDLAIIDTVLSDLSLDLFRYANLQNHRFFAMASASMSNLLKARSSESSNSSPEWFSTPKIQEAHRVLSGRFHGAIASLAVGQPTLLTASNTAKNQSLAEDIGVDLFIPRDLLPSNEIQKWTLTLEKKFEIWQRPTTQELVARYFNSALPQISKLFDQISDIAPPPL